MTAVAIEIAACIDEVAADRDRQSAALEQIIDALDCPAHQYSHRLATVRRLAYAALAGDPVPAPGGDCPVCGSRDCHQPVRVIA